MKIRKRQPNWPTGAQESLLRAAFLQGAQSIQAWEAWIKQTNIDKVDFGSQCIMPLVVKNLQAQGVTHPVFGKFKGVYRQNWYRNQIMFKEIAEALRAFKQQGIDSLVLKGGAMALRYYKDLGLRYMGDFDLLVHPQQIFPAIDELTRLGWTLRFHMDELNEINIRYLQEVQLTGPSGTKLDLHQHILFAHPDPEADRPFWASAIPLGIKNTPTLALDPTDQLFHVCVHGLHWMALPSLRWIADALLLLRAEASLDWERLINHAERWELVLTLKEALTYLAEGMGAPIPDEVLSSLYKMPITKLDHKSYIVYNLPASPLTSFRTRIFSYNRFFNRESDFIQRLRGFPRFLQKSWGLSTLGHTLLYAARAGVRLIGKFFSSKP